MGEEIAVNFSVADVVEKAPEVELAAALDDVVASVNSVADADNADSSSNVDDSEGSGASEFDVPEGVTDEMVKDQIGGLINSTFAKNKQAPWWKE